uniref:Interferon-induced protein 44-like n=1 Tax=Myripristis murdjan TaxID=586833 RepID=A0A667Z6E5_9TELE
MFSIQLSLLNSIYIHFQFNPVSPLSEGDPGYNSCPTLDDKVHILVCVIPADRLSVLSEEVKQKIRDIREAASDLGIPQLALFTKIDQACSVTESDIKNVYKSKYLKKQMEDFSADVGVPMNCIFPVKNYHSEIHMNDDIDSLILSALRQMVDFGDDFVNMS